MYSSTMKIRVKYGETDPMGFLYYGHYPAYYEAGRSEAIRALGFTYRQLEESGVIMPVVELTIKYLRPALYDDLVSVRTTLRELPQSSKIVFHSELFNEQEVFLNKGVTTLVFYDSRKKQKIAMPDELRKKLAPFFQTV